MKYTNPPWWIDADDEVIIIRGTDGDSICAMRRNTGDRLPEEQDANAALISLAPELFRAVSDLMRVMRASDIEQSVSEGVTGDELDEAIEEAQALIDLLAESGVELEGQHDA